MRPYFIFIYGLVIQLLFEIATSSSQNCDPKGFRLQYGSLFGIKQFQDQSQMNSQLTITFYSKVKCNDINIKIYDDEDRLQRLDSRYSQRYFNTSQPVSIKKPDLRKPFECYVSMIEVNGLENCNDRLCYYEILEGQTLLLPKTAIYWRGMERTKGYVQKVLIFGDFDETNKSQFTQNYLKNQTEANKKLILDNKSLSTGVSAIIHVGDLGYDLPNNYGQKGLDFMDKISPITSEIPYMSINGNHEELDNFEYYNTFFENKIATQSPFFYSWNLGDIHFLTLTLSCMGKDQITPYLEDPNYYVDYFAGGLYKKELLRFIEDDLRTIRQVQDQQPWVIVYTHCPFYCSFRSCQKIKNAYDELEDLFQQYKVDLVISGHIHYYERTLPMLRGEIDSEYMNSNPDIHAFKDLESPIFVVEGLAGNSHDLIEVEIQEQPYSVQVQQLNQSLGCLTTWRENGRVYIKYEHILSQTGEVLDHFTIEKKDIQDRAIFQLEGEGNLEFSTLSTFFICSIYILSFLLIGFLLYLVFQSFRKNNQIKKKESYSSKIVSDPYSTDVDLHTDRSFVELKKL